MGGFTADGGENRITTNAGDDDVYIEGDLNATNGRAEGGGINLFDLGAGNDMLTLIGNVTASNGGKNTINGGAGDDTIHLNGHVDAGALSIMGGEGNDTLILTAATQSRFEADYKEWLLDLSSSGSLADSGIETIRLDVRNVQTAKLGWLTDLIDQANADGAHITLEDKNGNVIVEPQLYLSQDNPSAAIDPITALLDQHAPVAEEAAQSKAFALTAAQHAPEHNFAFDIANNNFIQDLEQHAQAAVVA